MALSEDRDAVRTALISVLVDEHRLLDVARSACAAAGIPDRQQAVGYCLAVLAQKRDAAERGLVLGSPDFASALAEQASVVAQNMRRWAGTYQAIQEESERFELTTVRRYVYTPIGADVIDAAAAVLGELLGQAVPLDEMTLSLADLEEPAGSEYVFQSPLEAWLRLSARRLFPPRTAVLEEDVPVDGTGDELLAGAEEADEEVLGLLARRIGEVLATRESLAALIERADGFDAEVARMRPASATHARLLVRLQATIVELADRLRRERRALRDLLAYVVLGLGAARRQQAVTILSLRSTSIEPDVVASMAAQMRAMLTDADQPTPSLIVRAEEAVARGVPKRRAGVLRKLREHPGERAQRLVGVARMLDQFPPAVADNAAIAAAMPQPCDAHLVAVNRSVAGREFDAVDRWIGRVHRRYTMGAS